MRSFFRIIGYGVVLMSPLSTLAATAPRNVADLIGIFTNILLLAVPIVFSLTLFVFFWGLTKFFFFSGDNDEARADGRRLMVWGTIALFVMLSIWGFIRILQDTLFGGRGGGIMDAPVTKPPALNNSPTIRI